MEISIKNNNKQNRDQFLGELVARNDYREMVQTALDLVSSVDQIKTQYDRANARTCAAILWWFAGDIENAKLHNNLAIKELTKPQMRRDRLTFLVKHSLSQEIPAEMVRHIFVAGAANA